LGGGGCLHCVDSVALGIVSGQLGLLRLDSHSPIPGIVVDLGELGGSGLALGSEMVDTTPLDVIDGHDEVLEHGPGEEVADEHLDLVVEAAAGDTNNTQG